MVVATNLASQESGSVALPLANAKCDEMDGFR
jgi:hypothetical protein